jgi:D-xylose transport system substrate-binding protein
VSKLEEEKALKVSKRFVVIATVCLGALAITSIPLSSRVLAARSHAGISGKVGFLFSDFTTSARWQFDRKYFIQDLKKLDPNVTVIVTDAKAAQTVQQNQAKSDLTQGAKVLIDVPVDSAGAASIVRAAHQNKPKVKVIAYDRLITGVQEDAYVSFNGFQVGVQQGQYLKKHVKKGGTIVEIAGSPTDNNAALFHQGARSVLQPLFKSQLKNKVNGVLVANDGMAIYVIQALKAQHLNGKIPVTGQDATVAGLQQVLLGNQSMSVYKPLRTIAGPTAQIVDKFLHGKTFTSSVKTSSGAGPVPSVIKPVETVTRSNMKSTVIKDGFVTKAELCTSAIPKSDCKGL